MKRRWFAGSICFFSLLILSSCTRSQGELLAEKGSWWTDGDIHYEVVMSTPDSLRMEGFSLHEGGMELVIARGEDGEWRIDGAYGFGFSGSVVRKQSIQNGENGDASLNGENGGVRELLVAYYPEDADDYLEEWQTPRAGRPMQVLERFEGELVDYDLKAIHRFLANTYWDVEDTTRVWIFYADGTVSMGKGAEPKPYEIERVYHYLTNVISFPNGERWGVLLNGKYLHLTKVEWNEEWENWMEEEEFAHQMEYDVDYSWMQEQLFCGPINTLLFRDFLQELQTSAQTSEDAFEQLNGAVMRNAQNEGSL